jgi:hypothetical protein
MELLRERQCRRGHDCDCAWTESTIGKQSKATEGRLKGGFAVTMPPMRVMNEGRAVEANANSNVICREEVAPFIINEGTIRLKGVYHVYGVADYVSRDRKRSFVKLDPE